MGGFVKVRQATKADGKRRVFRPKRPQRDIPVAMARFFLRTPGLNFDRVKRVIPAWDVDLDLPEESKVKEMKTRYGYADYPHRPTEEKATMVEASRSRKA